MVEAQIYMGLQLITRNKIDATFNMHMNTILQLKYVSLPSYHTSMSWRIDIIQC